eukprot:UN19754
MVHLATIPITGTGINPARSLGAAVIYNNEKAWGRPLDLLGGAIHRRRHRRLIPPVRAEGQRHQVRLVRLLRQPLDRRPAAVLDGRRH